MRFYLFDVVAIIIFFLQVKLLKEHGKGGGKQIPRECRSYAKEKAKRRTKGKNLK